VVVSNFGKSYPIRRIAILLVAVVALAGVVASIAAASGHVDEEAAPIFGVKIPTGVETG
jgi:hypothetical protein